MKVCKKVCKEVCQGCSNGMPRRVELWGVPCTLTPQNALSCVSVSYVNAKKKITQAITNAYDKRFALIERWVLLGPVKR